MTMKKHPSCYKLNEPLKAKNAQVHSEPVVLYDGMFNIRKTYPLSRSGLGTLSLYSTFVGGELLPAEPFQACAGAPSGRGHLFSGWVNLAHVIIPATMSSLQYRHGAPLSMAPCA